MTTGGIWRIGIPGFHELDQHLEAPLLPGVRVMVTLVFASCYFLSFPLVLLLFLLLFFFLNSSCLLLLLLLLFPPPFILLAQHRFMGAVVFVDFMFCSHVWEDCIFMCLLFEKPTKICCRCFALFVAYPLVVRFVVLFIPCVLPLLIMS